MCADVCGVECVHSDTVMAVREQMETLTKSYEMAEMFKVLSDQTRVNILSALLLSELCVCDIAAVLSMERTAISHQLRILRHARLVQSRREGKVVYYSLADGHVVTLFNQVLEHINE